MKAFIVAALLVATVAGQSLDVYKSLNKDVVISKKGMMSNRFLNNLYGGDYSNMINGDYYNDYPSTTQNYFGGDEDMYNVLSYEQIMVHPMFREYMTLPLFRQYWSYPMFQRYVCSHYFQRYWTMPAFQQYFVQPTLFYKYIYPMVQLFKYDAATTTTTTSNNFYYPGGDYSAWNRNMYPIGADYFQGQQQQQQFNQGGIPTVCYYNSMYCRALVQKMYNHLMYNNNNQMTTEETMTVPMDVNADVYKYNPYYARMMYPTVYNKDFYPTVNNKDFYPTVNNKDFYPTVYNKEFQNFEVPSRTLINNEDLTRPVFSTNTFTKAMIGDKKVVPEQFIRA